MRTMRQRAALPRRRVPSNPIHDAAHYEFCQIHLGDVQSGRDALRHKRRGAGTQDIITLLTSANLLQNRTNRGHMATTPRYRTHQLKTGGLLGCTTTSQVEVPLWHLTHLEQINLPA